MLCNTKRRGHLLQSVSWQHRAVWLHQVTPKVFLPSTVLGAASYKCSGKGHRTKNCITPPSPSRFWHPDTWETAVNTPGDIYLSVNTDYQFQKLKMKTNHSSDSSKNYRGDYSKSLSWQPAILNRAVHSRSTSHHQQSFQGGVAFCVTLCRRI